MTQRYWHFLAADRRLRYDDGREVKPGSVLTVPDDRPLELCRYGMHASRDPLDALAYAPGPVVCRVTLAGDILHGDDKSVAHERRAIWMADAEDTLRQFAYKCADRAVRVHAAAALRKVGRDQDADTLVALRPITDKKTADATYSAADSAARSAADWAAALSAALSARSAADSAARGAAYSAADSAADAAYHAARSAAYSAERARQSTLLGRMLLALGRTS